MGPVKQYFRGRFQGHYLGAQTQGADGSCRYQVQIYQGSVHELTFHQAAAEPDPLAASPGSLHQAELRRARLVALPGRGDSYDADLFDLELREPRFGHPARHAGRIYGSVSGTASGWFQLPPPPAPPESVEPTTKAAAPQLSRSKGKTVESSPEKAQTSLDAAPVEEPTDDKEDPAPPELRETPRTLPTIPLAALMVALSLALLVTCDAATVGLWLLFVGPTLVLRRFLRGVLEDSSAMRGIAAFLVLAQLAFTFWVLAEWTTSPCKELHVVPVLGLIALVFLSGILPFTAPFSLNAFCFALVLWSFGSEPGVQCGNKPVAAEVTRPPSVKDPGVPRTGPDGRWPRDPSL